MDAPLVRHLTPLTCSLRWIELIAVFALLPWLATVWRLQRAIIPILLAGCGLVLFMLLRDSTFDRKQLWNVAGLAIYTSPWLWLALAGGTAFLFGFTYWASKTSWAHASLSLFSFPRHNPRFWALVMLAYPILSVYPQELIFRTFFFHRYAPLLPSSPLMMVVNGLAFGWAHILLRHWDPGQLH
jgi:hypothetical protein